MRILTSHLGLRLHYGWGVQMPQLELLSGSFVGFRDQNWRIVATFGTERACIVSVDGHQKIMVPIAELQPLLQAKEHIRQLSFPFEQSPERTQGERWMECIHPLRNLADRSKKAIKERAAEYKMHPATLYRRLATWDRHGRVEALVRRSDGGRGKSRLRPEVDELIDTSIDSHYLNKQRLTAKDVAMEVRRACEQVGLPVPHPNTVAKRIRTFSKEVKTRRRHGGKAAELYRPRPKRFEGATT